MSWSFRTKLILAFLLFSLVPTLLMTLVTFEATEQVKDRAARVIYRSALSNDGTDRTHVEKGLNRESLVDGSFVGKTMHHKVNASNLEIDDSLQLVLHLQESRRGDRIQSFLHACVVFLLQFIALVFDVQ